MKPELRHLRYLLAVAEQGSFTRAAEELRISQPTLSQQIRQMEKGLGVQLLDRSGRSVRLTDAGAVYAVHAQRALRELDAAQRAVLDVHDLSRGYLRLAATPTLTASLVGPLVADFQTSHPGIDIEVREWAQDRIESEILADRIDLGLGFADVHLPGVEATALSTESLSLVVGPQGRGGGSSINELSGRPLVLLSSDHATRRRIDEHFAAHGVRPRVAVETDSISALMDIVARTPLATVLPDALVGARPHLTPVPLDPALPSRVIALLRRANTYQSAAAKAFVQHAKDGRPPRAVGGST